MISLQAVDLSACSLSTDQLENFCQILNQTETLQLTELGLSLMNLSEVNEGILTRTIIRIRKVSLAETQMKPYQLNVLLDSIIEQEEIAVQEIDLSGNIFTPIDADKLGECLIKLKTVMLRYCQLQADQICKVCEKILEPEGGRQVAIRELNVEGNRVSKDQAHHCDFLISMLKRIIKVSGLGDVGWEPTPLLRLLPPRPYYFSTSLPPSSHPSHPSYQN